MRMKNSRNRLKIFLIIAIAITFVTGLSATYAFFIYRAESGNVSLETEELEITFANGKNYFNVDNSYPVSDATGMILSYYSDFTVNATTTDIDIKYEIQIVPNSGNTIDPQYIKVYLTDQDDNAITGISFYNDLSEASYNENAKTIYSNYITTTGSKDFRLRVWIDEKYSNTAAQDFGFTIYLYAINDKANFLSDAIIENLTLTNADSEGTKFVTGGNDTNNYVWYSGKLWRIVAFNGDGSIKLVTQGNMTSISWNTIASTDYSTSQVHSWLNNEFLPTLSNVNILLVDHVWDYTLDTTIDKIKPITDTSKTINEKVGLLTNYEYMMTGVSSYLHTNYTWSTMTPSTENSQIWSVQYSDGNLAARSVYSNGSSDSASVGIRPSINLVADVKISGGDGTKENPFVIYNDKGFGKENDLLNSRLSGEYIQFNNTLYRIIGTDVINGQKLVKVTMADYSKNGNSLVEKMTFGNSIEFSSGTGIGQYLDNWYNATETTEEYLDNYINNTYKSMIATADDYEIMWYQGPNSGINCDYTLSKTGTSILSTIGLSYYGEMFASQFGDGSDLSSSSWLITKNSSSDIMYVDGSAELTYYSPSYEMGIRPSFYLKPNVVIGDVDGDGNVGTGMPNNPYEIKQ